jgi:GNAT superfamily N-acetyltransferase
VKFRIREVDATEEHYHEELTNLHDLTFFDASIRADFERGYWWLVNEELSPVWNKNGPIAFCGFTHALNDPGAGYLKRVGVLKAYRGQGLQRRLITVRERKARTLGLVTMLTDTTENPPSANSLISAGYKTFEPAYRWAFQHSTYWKKDLTK